MGGGGEIWSALGRAAAEGTEAEARFARTLTRVKVGKFFGEDAGERAWKSERTG